MPYIAPEDRTMLDSLMSRLAEEIGERVLSPVYKFKAVAAFKYLAYASLKFVKEVSLDAAEHRHGVRRMRYWLVPITGGVFMNVAFELERRLKLPALKDDQEAIMQGFCNPLLKDDPEDLAELDPCIENLCREVTFIARRYAYDGAFAGLCNNVRTLQRRANRQKRRR